MSQRGDPQRAYEWAYEEEGGKKKNRPSVPLQLLKGNLQDANDANSPELINQRMIE